MLLTNLGLTMAAKDPFADLITIKLVVLLKKSEPIDTALNAIYVVLKSTGNLLDLKNGQGDTAYDGHGFDIDTNAFEFFFYFKKNGVGTRQLKRAQPLLIAVTKKLNKKKYKTDILVRN